jgi:hypothetical protein
LILENIVPLGENKDQVYLTGLGDHRLSRTHLFQPGKAPVNVIVPDNAWELGYSSLPVQDDLHLAGLSRRTGWNEQAQRRRFETVLLPGGNGRLCPLAGSVPGRLAGRTADVFPGKISVRHRRNLRRQPLPAQRPAVDPPRLCHAPHHGLGPAVL